MQSTTLRAYVGKDGILRLEIPTVFSDIDVDVVVIFHPVKTATEKKNNQVGLKVSLKKLLAVFLIFLTESRRVNTKRGMSWNDIPAQLNSMR